MKVSRRTFLQGGLAATIAGLETISPEATRAAARPPRTLAEKVGQLFVVSFAGTVPSPTFLSLLQRLHIGGVVLYARNCSSAGQIRRMLTTLQRAASYPLLVCTDQEGGEVVRIRSGVKTFPAEAAYGLTGSTASAYNDAATTARALRALGLTMNLAPVVDVLSNARSPIGDRSYGPNAALAARLSTAAIRGYQANGMAATAKHFIGLGHASIDSHQALPVVHQTLAQFERVDLVPFRAAISAGVSSMLVAHVALPAIDPTRRPASLSPVIINGIIRKRLGFKGLIMTDSLRMGALPTGGTAGAAEQAFAAGADILLVSSDKNIPVGVYEDAVTRVISAVRSGRVPESRLDSAVARILALKKVYRPAVT